MADKRAELDDHKGTTKGDLSDFEWVENALSSDDEWVDLGAKKQDKIATIDPVIESAIHKIRSDFEAATSGQFTVNPSAIQPSTVQSHSPKEMITSVEHATAKPATEGVSIAEPEIPGLIAPATMAQTKQLVDEYASLFRQHMSQKIIFFRDQTSHLTGEFDSIKEFHTGWMRFCYDSADIDRTVLHLIMKEWEQFAKRLDAWDWWTACIDLPSQSRRQVHLRAVFNLLKNGTSTDYTLKASVAILTQAYGGKAPAKDA